MSSMLGSVGRRIAVACGLVVAISFASSRPAAAQSGSQLRGAGAYLEGLGWYNLNTARATSINVDTVIRWKADLRKIQAERRVLDAQNKAEKKLKMEEVKRKLAEREQQLRIDPSAADVHSGDALDVLLYDLTDPQITSDAWAAKRVQLPEGMSVKDMIFRFTPLSASSSASVALGRGVIALSRLDIAGKWPTPMKMEELANGRAAYERAYAQVREEVIKGELDVKSLLELDRILELLKARAMQVVPPERGYRAEAVRFVDDLKDATRMFDAATVDYAREILIDTQDHDAATVQELVAFMLKYRLQFASAERHPAARELYMQLYASLREQVDAITPKPKVSAPLAADGEIFSAGSTWAGERYHREKGADPNKKGTFEVRISERKGSSFIGRFEINSSVYDLTGTVDGENVEFKVRGGKANIDYRGKYAAGKVAFAFGGTNAFGKQVKGIGTLIPVGKP